MADNRQMDVDDFLDFFYQIDKKMRELQEKRNFDERMAKMLLQTDDPDSRFKANLIIRMMNAMSRLDFFINYIHQPVKMEGMLQQKLDGTVRLNEIVIDENTNIEIMTGGEWQIGMLKRNPSTRRFEIQSPDGKCILEKIEQIQARIR